LKSRFSPRRAIVSGNLSHQMDDSAPQLGIVYPDKCLDEPQPV
jgi:hypothetical protein